MFTVWDPMHDGIDNDGDGPWTRTTRARNRRPVGTRGAVYGVVDMNTPGPHGVHADARPAAAGAVHEHVLRRTADRGRGGHVSDWLSMARGEHRDCSGWTTEGMAGRDDRRVHKLERLAVRRLPQFGQPRRHQRQLLGQGTPMTSWVLHDEDSDGIKDERDERDYWFTQMSNFMTTRSQTFTVEVVAQMTDPRTIRSQHPARRLQVEPRLRAEELILLVDRSTTLRFRSRETTGPATSPVRCVCWTALESGSEVGGSMSVIEVRAEAVLVREGRILLVNHEKRGESYWVLPGDTSSTRDPRARARAEMREELALDVAVGALALVHDYIAPTATSSTTRSASGPPANRTPSRRRAQGRAVGPAGRTRSSRPASAIAEVLRRIAESPDSGAVYLAGCKVMGPMDL